MTEFFSGKKKYSKEKSCVNKKLIGVVESANYLAETQPAGN